MILKLKIDYGVSNILQYDYIFNHLLENGIVSKIEVCLNEELLNNLRETFPESFKNEYYEIMKIIFINKNIKIINNQNFDHINIPQLCNIFNIKIINR